LTQADALLGMRAIGRGRANFSSRPLSHAAVFWVDMIARGITEGRAIGEALRELQTRWIKAGFPNDPARLAQLLNDMPRGAK